MYQRYQLVSVGPEITPTVSYVHAQVNILFETAPPLADALFAKRPFSSYEELIDSANAIIAALSPEDRYCTPSFDSQGTARLT